MDAIVLFKISMFGLAAFIAAAGWLAAKEGKPALWNGMKVLGIVWAICFLIDRVVS